MHVGTAQSQSLIASLSVTRKTQISAIPLASGQGERAADAVLLSIGRRIDVSYATMVLDESLRPRLDAALASAGLELSTDDLLSTAEDTFSEATAQRIIEFATSFFEAFQNNQVDEDSESQISSFTELIKGAVKGGFDQARDILGGIGQKSGGVQADIDRTFSLTTKGLDAFAQEQRGALSPAQNNVGELVVAD